MQELAIRAVPVQVRCEFDDYQVVIYETEAGEELTAKHTLSLIYVHTTLFLSLFISFTVIFYQTKSCVRQMFSTVHSLSGSKYQP